MTVKIMKATVPAALVLLSALCGFYVMAKIRPLHAQTQSLARAHSVIYVERSLQNGKLTSERIILRTVTNKGVVRKDVLWPHARAPIEVSSEGLSTSKPDGTMAIASKDVVSGGTESLKPLTEGSKEKASEVRTIAGLKTWVFKSDPNAEVVLDRAFAEETGFTPLWTHMIVKKTGFEVVSEALRVIWGTQEKDG